MYFSKYNTSTLAYKLLSGQLKKNRVHSEQLNKYLAGLVDTDGCVSLFFYKTRTSEKQRVSVTLSLTQSATNDQDFEVIRSLRDFYNIGSLYYKIEDGENTSSTCTWTMRDKETRILFNRIGKHMRLKATHLDNMIWISDQHKDVEDISQNIIEELKAYCQCSRKNSRWLKMPKHLSWSYVAGVIAGNGCIKLSKRENKDFYEMRLKITQSADDKHLLELFKRDFKGNIYSIRSWCDWERNLGYGDASFAVPFLEKIRSYIMHEKKYSLIQDILELHNIRKQQRLNREYPKG